MVIISTLIIEVGKKMYQNNHFWKNFLFFWGGGVFSQLEIQIASGLKKILSLYLKAVNMTTAIAKGMTQ